MSDLITKNDVREGLKATIQKILETHANIAKNEAKADAGLAKLEKAWPVKQAGARLPRSSSSVFALVEGHRPIKANESLQHGDKIAINNGGHESWLTLDQNNPAHEYHIGRTPVTKDTWHANINKQFQRPISQAPTAAITPPAPAKLDNSAASIGAKMGPVRAPAPTTPSTSTWSSTSGAAPNYTYTKAELAKAGDPTNNPAFTGAGSGISDSGMGPAQISMGFDKAALNPVVKRAMNKTIPSMKKSLVPAPGTACPNCKGEVVIVGRFGNVEHGLCKGCGESPHRTIQEENVAAQKPSGLNTDSQMPAGQTVQDANKSALPKEGLGKAELAKVTPPGEEKLVHKLKDEYGHDKAGKEKAYATAWAIHNKMTKTALPAVVRNAMKKDETDSHIKVRQDTVVEKPMPGAEMPPKDPKAPEKNGNGRTDSNNNGIIKGKLNKGAISDAVDKAREKAHVSKDKNLKGIGFPGVPKELNKKSIAAVEAEKAKEKAEREAQNPARKIPKNFAEKQKEKQEESGQVQKAEGIPSAPTAPKPAGNKIPKIAPPIATKPITTIPPQQSKL